MAYQGKFLGRTMQNIQLTAEPVPGLPLVEVMGTSRVLIEGHRGIVCYNDKEISVRTSMGCICIFGNKMTLAQMTRHRLVICGSISSVQFV